MTWRGGRKLISVTTFPQSSFQNRRSASASEANLVEFNPCDGKDWKRALLSGIQAVSYMDPGYVVHYGDKVASSPSFRDDN